jgi:hypothetical protein
MTKKEVPRERPYPYWTYPSKRVFQRSKRAELRALKKAFEAVRCGCAYMPGYKEHWGPLEKHLKALIEKARPRSWK